MKLLLFLTLALSVEAGCRIHLVKNPDAIVLNGREYSTCAVAEQGADPGEAELLSRPLAVGDRIGLLFKDGTNVTEEVSTVVTNIHQVEFTDGATVEIGEEHIDDVIRAIMKTEDMIHTRQETGM